MSRRILAWRAALAELRNDRATPARIREERLNNFGKDLSAWRGDSGRRYVVRRYALDLANLEAASQGLALAVRRDADGRAAIVSIAGTTQTVGWFARARSAGATELHVHSLAPEEERGAIVMDLLR